MKLQNQWDDPLTREQYLAEQLNNSRLSVVLGAGVSRPCGLPDWKTLIARLFDAVGLKVPSDGDEKKQAEYFRSEVCRGNEVEFLDRVTEALYDGSDLSLKSLSQNQTVAALAALIMSSVRGNVASVVSFNFDDVVEVYLEYHGFVVQSVPDESTWNARSDVEILHPHGLLPSGPARERSKRIVLDQKEYSKITGDEARPWRQRMLSQMRTRTCLFVGVSGGDEHMDSLIVRCQETHASAVDGTRFWGVWYTNGQDAAAISSWRNRGVYPDVVGNDYEDLPKRLFGICQTAARKRAAK